MVGQETPGEFDSTGWAGKQEQPNFGTVILSMKRFRLYGNLPFVGNKIAGQTVVGVGGLPLCGQLQVVRISKEGCQCIPDAVKKRSCWVSSGFRNGYQVT